MDSIHAAGRDVAALVDQVTTERLPPADHPARSLDYRLAPFTPSSPARPPTPQVAIGPTGASDRSPRPDSPTAAPTPPARTPPSGPTSRTGPGR
jgi:hypothetical protein